MSYVDGFVLAVPTAKREAYIALVLAWIIWPSKEARDSGMAKVNADPRSAHHKPENIPFDGKRMIFGGFTPIVELD